ncbi:hypothetical protein L839_3847 [Mycobacterium avium MAV_120809_2495]|nr:hypothetical protein L839_3847 [Mycobacterium avium MAV_120809_2495]
MPDPLFELFEGISRKRLRVRRQYRWADRWPGSRVDEGEGDVTHCRLAGGPPHSRHRRQRPVNTYHDS